MKTYSVGPRRERVKEQPCALCGSAAHRPHFESGGAAFVRCRACGLVFQNPQPVFEDLKHRYRAEYFRYELDNAQNFFDLMRLGLRDIGFERLAPGDPGAPRGNRFLDVGCATGALLAYMQGLGWEVQGVEICTEAADYGRRERGVEIVTVPLEEAGFPSGSFSIVHFSHLIEHVPDPRGFLREVRRILVPGGTAIVTTPNIAGFQARLFGPGWRSAIADHLTLFSARTLRRLLEEEQFRVLKVRTWGGLAAGAAPMWIKRPVDRLSKTLGCGDVMLFLAVKP